MFSRELHDRIGQMLAAALVRMELNEHYMTSGDLPAARVKWDESHEIVQRALALTKTLAIRARTLFTDVAAADAIEGGIVPGIFPPHLERREELYLVLREALDNALSHSGAEDITIQLSVDGNRVVATVDDNGCGVPRERQQSLVSLGLRSMAERVKRLGGTFSLTSLPSSGTRVSAQVPMRDGRS
jgi:signal transduction histidine kinase